MLQLHAAILLVTMPPPPPGDMQYFCFLEVWSPLPGTQKETIIFPTPELLIDLIYVFCYICWIKLKYINKDPSSASQTSLAGFRLHQPYRTFCAWLDHTQCRGLFTAKANDDAPSDVNTMPQWKLFSYFENDWCWYGRFFVQNIPFTLPVILFNTSAPASAMQKNPQRRKIICGMHLVWHEGRYWSKDAFVEYPVRVISVAVLVATF